MPIDSEKNLKTIECLYFEMADDTQPQRAIHNWLKSFVDMASNTIMRTTEGRVCQYNRAELISWIQQFCNADNMITNEEK